eukprot:15334812-Ditylum_brightwellii.AAC.1
MLMHAVNGFVSPHVSIAKNSVTKSATEQNSKTVKRKPNKMAAAKSIFMKAVRCHRYASFDEKGKCLLSTPLPLRDVLSLDDNVLRPTLNNNDDHVLIQTHYAGVQYPDFLQARGLYQHKPTLPYIPGIDVSGTILETSSNDGLNVGDRVVASSVSNLGCLAEFVKVPTQSVWK